MKKKKMSNTALIWIYLLVSIVGILIVSNLFNGMVEQHDGELTIDIDNLIAEKIDNSLNYMMDSIEGMSTFISFQESIDMQELYAQLIAGVESAEYVSVGLIETDGTVYGTDYEREEFDKWNLKTKALATEDFVVSEPYRSAMNGKLVFTVFAPIAEQNKRIGCVFVTYPLTEIQEIANTAVLKDDVEIYLMNVKSENMILCSGEDEFKIGNWSSAKLQRHEIEETDLEAYNQWENQMKAGVPMGTVNFHIDGVSYTQVYRTIDSMEGWTVLVRIPNSMLSDTLQRFKRVMTIFVCVLILVFIIILIVLRTRDRQEQEKFEYMSTHDALTDVYNRNAIDMVAKNFLDNEGKTEHGVLIFMDVDYFKQINDRYGHDVGDKVLVTFADNLRELFGEDTFIARYGGDEFVLLVKHIDSPKALNQRLDSLKKKLQELEIEGTDDEFDLHYSAGISVFPDHGQQFEELVKCADIALYEVKEQGRNSYRWYEA